MKFRLMQTSIWNDEKTIVKNHDKAYLNKDGKAEIKITSLKALIELLDNSVGGSLVIEYDFKGNLKIEDYDDWRE